MIILPSVSEDEARQRFPGGWKAPKPYLRIVPQPKLASLGPSPENMEKQFSKTVLAVVNDLFFSAKINEAAKRAGVTLKYVTTEKDLLEKAKADPALIIFDLNFEAVRPIESIRKLKGTDELKHISLLGYLSHVQTDLQRLAQEAGCDTVMPRSAFSMNLSQILMRHAGAGA